jgi:hypothetical protein
MRFDKAEMTMKKTSKSKFSVMQIIAVIYMFTFFLLQTRDMQIFLSVIFQEKTTA